MAILEPTPLAFLRIDQVGSLLRPAFLKDIFIKHEQGLVSDETLLQAQNEAIRQVIARQDAHHLPIVTDGEYRRINFMASFADVEGYQLWKSLWQPLPSPEEQALLYQAEQREERISKGGAVRTPHMPSASPPYSGYTCVAIARWKNIVSRNNSPGHPSRSP